jgi:predicted DNA-binding protein
MAIATDAKLTVKLPELLRRQAKAVAALRGETVSNIVREALEAYVAEVLEENEDIRIVQEIEARIAAGNEPIYSHDDVWAEVESLEAQSALPN